MKTQWKEEELWFPRLIVVPLSSQEVDGVRKEKERLTTAINLLPGQAMCPRLIISYLPDLETGKWCPHKSWIDSFLKIKTH